MSEIILHHYPDSFFAEKIRRILAFKGLAWRSVVQPQIMPKPQLTALTGGYRRVPVMQIGADLYCDTALIARQLERLAPAPAILPPAQAALAGVIEDWADRRLVAQVGAAVVVARMPTLEPGFLEDRAAMSPFMGEKAWRRMAPQGWAQAQLSFDRLDAMLRHQPFILGDGFTLADAACFHPLWFVASVPALFAAVAQRPALAAWYGRVQALGSGGSTPMEPAEALAVARASEPATATATGETVEIMADDYGPEKVTGTVAEMTGTTITLHRHDSTAGRVAVHFPRAGYRISRLSPELAAAG